MTVAELIEWLKQAPPDYPVVYAKYSDFWRLEAEELKVQHAKDGLKFGCAVNHHNSKEIERCWSDDQANATPINCVIFPGN